MTKHFFLCLMLAFAATLITADVSVAQNEPKPEEPTKLLGIGSPAPQLDIEYWYGDQTRPTEIKFESGHIYVVEFWATWCGPCIQGMPHLAKLQKEFADQKVTVIGVSDEKPETVKAFLKREVKDGEGDDKMTYGELTAAYRLGSDPDESTFNDYMMAAKQTGIPAAFIVGKSGLIEWVGNPGGMDDVLKKVISDEWDGTKLAKKLSAEQQLEMRLDVFYDALEEKDLEAARKVVEEIRNLKGLPDAEDEANFMAKEIEFIVLMDNIKTDPEKATKDLSVMFGNMKGDTRGMFFSGMELIEGKLDQDLPVTKEQFKIVADACEAEVDDAGVDTGIILNILGHLHHQMGDRKKSEEFHKRAIAYDKTAGGKNTEWYQDDLDVMLGKKQREAPEPEENRPQASVSENSIEVSGNGLTATVLSQKQIAPGGKLELKFVLSIPDGHHIYGSQDEAQPTEVAIAKSKDYSVGKAKVPTGEKKETITGPRHYLTGSQRVTQFVTVSHNASGNIKVTGQLNFMICQDEVCRPTKLPFELTVAVISQQSKSKQHLPKAADPSANNKTDEGDGVGFPFADTDSDGFVSRKELQKYLAERLYDDQLPHRKIFDQLDSDSDKQLTEIEFEKRRAVITSIMGETYLASTMMPKDPGEDFKPLAKFGDAVDDRDVYSAIFHRYEDFRRTTPKSRIDTSDVPEMLAGRKLSIMSPIKSERKSATDQSRRLPATSMDELYKSSVILAGGGRDFFGAGGVIVSNDGLVLTNFHVAKAVAEGPMLAMTHDGKTHPVIEFLAGNRDRDVALIRLKGSGFTSVKIAGRIPKPGDDLEMVHHSENRFYTYDRGYLLRHAVVGEHPWMEVSMDYAPGGSGCGIFNEQRELVGLVAMIKFGDGVAMAEAHENSRQHAARPRPSGVKIATAGEEDDSFIDEGVIMVKQAVSLEAIHSLWEPARSR